ncbi:MAG: hypothetical protein QOF70_4391, partial [Acetobacteraceae bacterium]|nr:hypothetical protein [Acetobacteraceae bacterium]
MFEDGIVGMTEASITRNPCSPRTLSSGSTTAVSSRPSRAVPQGWLPVGPSRHTYSRISLSVWHVSDGLIRRRINEFRGSAGDRRETGGGSACRVFSLLFSDRGWGVEWILRLAAAGGEGSCVDIMEISKPDDLGDIANLGLTLAEAKQLLARVQCEIS